MSQGNVEIVRRVLEAFDEYDFPGMAAHVDEQLVSRRHSPLPDPGVWHGLEGAAHVNVEWEETFGRISMVLDELIDAGEHVVVGVSQVGRGEGSGVPVTGSFWYVYGFRDGRIATWDMYATRRDALEAVGLSD